MQDPVESLEDGQPDTGQNDAVASPEWDDLQPDAESDGSADATVLAEVMPGVAVLFGEVPDELSPDLIGFGLVPAEDLTQISTVLASIGSTATVGGNLANALTSARGLYKLSGPTRAYMLKTGGSLAVKEGARLGTIISPSGLAQARFIPVTTVSAASAAAAIGPALAMVALQMSLHEVAGLVKANLALTNQVLSSIRNEQWAALTGLVHTLDDAISKAQAVGSVTQTLWDTVAGQEAELQAERDHHRRNVSDHVKKINQFGRDTRGRREYLTTNAEAIVFDAYALRSSLQAWTQYQMLKYARARAAGLDDPSEARYAESIAHGTPDEVQSGLAEITTLVDALTRELKIIAELPGHTATALPRKRKDSRAARHTSAQLLGALQPLADALLPPADPLPAPPVVCAPEDLDHEPYLRVLRWRLDQGESLRCLGFPYQLAEGEVARAVAQRVLGVLDGEKWAARIGFDHEDRATLVAVTDRRIITAKPSELLQRGEASKDIPIDQIRYVRSGKAPGETSRAEIDLITRDKDIQWLFGVDTDTAQVDALAAVLAEAMTIPDVERDELVQWAHPPNAPVEEAESAGEQSAALLGHESTVSGAK